MMAARRSSRGSRRRRTTPASSPSGAAAGRRARSIAPPPRSSPRPSPSSSRRGSRPATASFRFSPPTTIAAGLAAALLSGATLECHGLFDAAGLGQALDNDVPTHLVAPGWLEPAIAAAGLSSRLASTVLVHAAPIRFRATMPLRANVVDVIAFDELALMARARDAAGRL